MTRHDYELAKLKLEEYDKLDRYKRILILLTDNKMNVDLAVKGSDPQSDDDYVYLNLDDTQKEDFVEFLNKQLNITRDRMENLRA